MRVKKREKPNDKRPWDTRAIGWKEQSFDFYLMGFPWWLNGKESACITGDPGLIPGLERSPGEWNDKPLQYTCLENPTDREPGELQSMRLQTVRQDWATDTFTSLSLPSFERQKYTDGLHSVSLGKKKVRRESRLKDGKTITIGIVKHTYSEKVFSLCHCKFELSIKIPDIKIS